MRVGDVTPDVHAFIQRSQYCAGLFSAAAYQTSVSALWSLIADCPSGSDLAAAEAITLVVALRRLSAGFLRHDYEHRMVVNAGCAERRVDEVLQIVRARYSTYGLSLCKIAENMHVTRSYLSRLLRHETGHSFPTHLNGVRLLAAVDAVARSGRVKEVASTVGYASTGELDRQFRRRLGFPPKQFALLANEGDRRLALSRTSHVVGVHFVSLGLILTTPLW